LFDLKKIDSFFSDETSLKKDDEAIFSNPRERKKRLIKLILPAVAAVLIGLLAVFPHLKSSQNNISFDITMPKKGELEKLHIESTRFYITDADNKISMLTADNIDETEPASKVVKLVNPKAKLPLKNGAFADIKSTSGFFDQANNKVIMVDDVFINYNDETSISTKNFVFDFKTSKGEGSSKIKADGIYGSLESDGFRFNNRKNIFNLLGRTKININHQPDNILIKAAKLVTLYKNEHKIIINGNASVHTGENTLFADIIEVFYRDAGRQPEIENLSANGNVCLISPKGTVYASRAFYRPQNGHVELFDNVIIEQGQNKLFGDYAQTNLNTGISKIVSKNKTSRVHGTFKKLKQLSFGAKDNGSAK